MDISVPEASVPMTYMKKNLFLLLAASLHLQSQASLAEVSWMRNAENIRHILFSTHFLEDKNLLSGPPEAISITSIKDSASQTPIMRTM